MSQSLLIRYVREYLSKRLNPEDFCRHVEEQMAAYEEMEEKKKREFESRKNIADDEGFITVVGKRTSAFSDSVDDIETDKQKTDTSATLKRKKDKSIGISFYSCKGAADELRAEHIKDLQSRFKEDRQKLEILKKIM